MKLKKHLLVLSFIFILTFVPIRTGAITSPALSHLEVETEQGLGNFNLSGGKKTFNFSLSSSLDYANIIATPTNESYQVSGAGKVQLKDGNNVIEVVITDPSDNSTEKYTINLNFSKSNSSNGTSNTTNGDVKNPETGSFVNAKTLILGVGVVIAIVILTKKKVFFKV